MRTHDIDGRQPWFRAKKYGWGWSWPVTWQGWFVLGIYCALIAFGAWRYANTHDPALGPAGILLTLLLVVICWITGEKPRWRWGDKD